MYILKQDNQTTFLQGSSTWSGIFLLPLATINFLEWTYAVFLTLKLYFSGAGGGYDKMMEKDGRKSVAIVCVCVSVFQFFWWNNATGTKPILVITIKVC